jgi:uncharacterized membrane protein
MSEIKLISKLEFDLINSNVIDYFDSFTTAKYEIGEEVLLRCYYSQLISSGNVDIRVRVLDISVASRNTAFLTTLYRIRFEKIC